MAKPEQTYDLLVPLEMPKQTTFNAGPHSRAPGINDETAFRFATWNASFHEFGEIRYIVLRLGLPLVRMRELLPTIFLRIARASVALDVSMRPVSPPLTVLSNGERADLDRLSAIPSGGTPAVQHRSSSFQVGLSVELFSDALGKGLSVDDNAGASRMFSDVDFEATPDSKFVLLSTILELLSVRQARDKQAQELLNKWKADAMKAKRQDLAQALDLMRSESIGTSIFELVSKAARAAGCEEKVAKTFSESARDAYRKRGKLLHAGVSVSKEELSTLRSIVRLVLVGDTKGTPFTPIGNGEWEEGDRF